MIKDFFKSILGSLALLFMFPFIGIMISISDIILYIGVIVYIIFDFFPKKNQEFDEDQV